MNQNEILDNFLSIAQKNLATSFLPDPKVQGEVEFICRCNTNKAPIRFLLACLLAKIDRPEIDIRKPYTEIQGSDAYSGRAYDEDFVEGFVAKHKLPCNSSTAFLTPAFRNIDRLLTTELVMVGKPREVYIYTLGLLDVVHQDRIGAEVLLKEILRYLLIIKTENEGRMKQLIADLKQTSDILPLSSEQIVALLHQHLNCKNSSRLPVLIVAAAYSAVERLIGEKTRPLYAHNAADRQTGSVGDIEVTLKNDEKAVSPHEIKDKQVTLYLTPPRFQHDEKVVSCYEMKDKRVTLNDINHALKKASSLDEKIDNYIFITTDAIENEVLEYAKSLYEQTGIEIAILDCLGFARHFLHFFHRYRIEFLNGYQDLVMKEPNSSVGQTLKEAFLILRKQAESD
jgi:hypothetical protein